MSHWCRLFHLSPYDAGQLDDLLGNAESAIPEIDPPPAQSPYQSWNGLLIALASDRVRLGPRLFRSSSFCWSRPLPWPFLWFGVWEYCALALAHSNRWTQRRGVHYGWMKFWVRRFLKNSTWARWLGNSWATLRATNFSNIIRYSL